MTIDISKVSWNSYSNFEGPVFWGSKPYVLPQDASFEEKTLSIISAAEGHYDSINMYDICIVTAGLIQWCERNQYSVSDMLGAVAEVKGVQYILDTLQQALKLSNATFKKNKSGKWRFFLRKGNLDVEVNTTSLQQECFLTHSGKKGEWSAESKLHAKTWCVALANIFQDDEACNAQLEFTKKRMFAWYVTTNAKKILFGSDTVNNGIGAAVKALVVSYAVNMPAVADKQLVIAVNNSKSEKWSYAWCCEIICQLISGSELPIWASRYNVIRPKLEEYFNIKLPKTTKELLKKPWLADPNSGIFPKEEELHIPIEVEPEIILQPSQPVQPETPPVIVQPSVPTKTPSKTLVKTNPALIIAGAVIAVITYLADHFFK